MCFHMSVTNGLNTDSRLLCDGSSFDLTSPAPGAVPLLRRNWMVGIAGVLAASWLTACAKPVPLFRVGSIVFPGYEFMFLAQDLELLDPQKIRLVELLSSSSTLRSLAAGQLEAAGITLDEMMTLRSQGVDLWAVMVFDVSAGADVVLGKPGITMRNLRGKRIGVEEGAMGAVMLDGLLDAAHLKAQDVRKVNTTLDRSIETYQQGTVDAIVTAEPWAATLEQQGAQRLFDSAQIPGRIVDVLAVRADALELHAPSIRALIAATFEARQRWVDAPEAAAQFMARRLQTTAQGVPKAFRGMQLPDVAQTREMLKVGGQLQQTAQELQKRMVDAGLLRKAAATDALVSNAFLPG